MDLYDPKPFLGSLVGISSEQVHVKCYITLKIMFRVEEHVRKIKVRCFVIYVLSSRNMIIGKPTFNKLGATISTLYMHMKYPLPDGRVGVIQEDQEISMKCYIYSLKLKKVRIMGVNIDGMKL